MSIEVTVFKFTTSTNTEQWLHPPLITNINMECHLIITIIASWICRIAENFRERTLNFTVLEPPMKVFSMKFGRAVPTYMIGLAFCEFSLQNGNLILTDLWKFSPSKVSRLNSHSIILCMVYTVYTNNTIWASGMLACHSFLIPHWFNIPDDNKLWENFKGAGGVWMCFHYTLILFAVSAHADIAS